MNMRVITYALWIAGPALQLCLAWVMWRGKLRRHFPLFFWYTVAQVTFFIPLFITFRVSYPAYFWSYWVTSVASIILGFAVMREVFVNLLRPYDSLRELGDVLFRWAAVVLILVAVVSAMSGNSTLGRQTVLVLSLERSVRVMQCGLVLFMLLFSSHLGLNSRHHVFGIALGFGVFAAVDLIIATLHSAFGPLQNSFALSLTKSFCYLLSIGLWIYYLKSPEPERKPIEARVQSQRWDMALAGIHNPVPQDGFMVAVESAVERVLSRREAEARK